MSDLIIIGLVAGFLLTLGVLFIGAYFIVKDRKADTTTEDEDSIAEAVPDAAGDIYISEPDLPDREPGVREIDVGAPALGADVAAGVIPDASAAADAFYDSFEEYDTDPAPPTFEAAAVPARAPESERLPLLDSVRLYRDSEGKLILEVGNTSFPHKEALYNDQMRAQLQVVLRDFSRWLSDVEPPKTSAATGADAAADAPAPAPTIPQEGDEVIKLTAREAAKIPIQQPSWNIREQLRQLREYEAAPKIEIKTMLEEVDDILQAKIAAMPLAERGFEIGEAPDGALRIKFDGVTYQAIDDLPDVEARSILRACIKEWEEKEYK